MIIHNDHIYTNWLAPSIGTAQSFPAKWTLQNHLLPSGSYTAVWKKHLYLSILCSSLHAVCVCVCVWYCLIVFWLQVFFPQILSPFQKLRKTLYWTCSVWVNYIRVYIQIYIYIYEQSPKLPNTKICIRWTLVFIKWKKLSLAMGPFQIAIPHVELHECWFRQVLASVIYLGSGLKEKDRERKRKEKEKEKGRKRKRNRKGKGRGNRKERKSKEKGKGKRKKRKRKEKRKDKEREKLKKDTKEKDRKRGSKRKGKEQILQKKNGSVLAIP